MADRDRHLGEPQPKKKPVLIGVGSPAILRLESWGRHVNDALGEMPYLVGSAVVSKKWRDVDVRVIFDDERFDEWFPNGIRHHGLHPRWSAFCLAFSAWGRETTGLPIDFQIQRRSEVTEADWDKPRNPIGLHWMTLGEL